MLDKLNRQRLADLLALSETDAYIELSRLYSIMAEDEWQELCDEYAQSKAEDN